MLSSLFTGLFDSTTASTIQITQFVVCMICSLILGVLLAGTYMVRSRASRSFLVTLAMLPVTVCVVIMMVNGNIGAGVAVAGTFSLVRFRSIPGTAKEIGMLFLAMAAGLITGMGYLGFAVLFTVIMCLIFFGLDSVDFGLEKNAGRYKTLRVTIPEDLDYTGVFDDIFERYTASHVLTQVKSTNMGSMFRLTYDVMLRDVAKEKEMLDAIRCRNGNLEITVSRQDTTVNEL